MHPTLLIADIVSYDVFPVVERGSPLQVHVLVPDIQIFQIGHRAWHWVGQRVEKS